MLRRHQDELFKRLEEIEFNGFAVIKEKEINRWYGLLSSEKTVWQDIKLAFDDLYGYEEINNELFVSPIVDGYLIVCGNKIFQSILQMS